MLELGEEENALVFVRGEGVIDIPWDGLSWPRHVNDDVISGPPESARNVVRPGDMIYVRRVAEGWRLAQFPEVQGAIVSLDPNDGAITALSGGFDFYASKFNRAVQTRRQPGSAFKPFIYSAALENGYTASTVINDAPIVIDDPTLEGTWRPENSTERFYGPTRMREGLVRSLNLLSVRLLLGMGIAPAMRHLEAFDLPETALPADPSLALGSGGASPLDMAAAYAVFASGGYRVKPYLVERVFDAAGNAVYETGPAVVCHECGEPGFDDRPDLPGRTNGPTPRVAPAAAESGTTDEALDGEFRFTVLDNVVHDVEAPGQTGFGIADEQPVLPDNIAPRAITAENAWLMYDMMRDVIQRGTGRRARQLNRTDLAGKTGTSDDQRDAWFSGFNGDLVATVWMGFDQDRSLGAGEEGARTALPVWIYFMEDALGRRPESPLEQPPGIVTARISSRTGLVTSAADSTAMFEVFREEHVPPRSPDSEIIPLPDESEAPETPDEIF